jgi:hypothetical protein
MERRWFHETCIRPMPVERNANMNKHGTLPIEPDTGCFDAARRYGRALLEVSCLPFRELSNNAT